MENLEIKQLAQIIYDYCGLNYTNNLSSLQMKVHHRLNSLNILSISEYIKYLYANEAEWTLLIEQITINETYFNREDKQLQLYQQTILPEISKVNNSVKIWSAGCSTGEEPYSLAILTKESNVNKSVLVQIDATDINQKVLSTAKKAIYNKKSLSFRRIPQHWIQQHFIDSENTYEVHPSVKKLVKFHYLNLIDEKAPIVEEKYDIIFCRNVLIYFDEETIKKVVTRFHSALKKGGYLFLGHAETITKLDIGFQTINANGTFYYRKETNNESI